MVSTFRILHLPYLALKNVFDSVYPQELLFLSICSQKMKRLVKMCQCASKNCEFGMMFGTYRDMLDIEYRGMIILAIEVAEMSSLPENRVLHSGKIGNFGVLMELNTSNRLITYWEDRLVGIKEVAYYAMDIFEKQLCGLSLGTDKSKNEPKLALDWVNSFQNSLESCYVSENCKLNDELASYILANTNVTERFTFRAKLSNRFRYTGVLPYSVNDFSVSPAKWVTGDHLLGMNCVVMSLEFCTLTSQDVNSFLKYWKDGGCSKLKEIRIKKTESDFDMETILNGVDHVEMPLTSRRKYQTIGGLTIPFRGGIDISKNSVTASIPLGLGGPNYFSMYVWPGQTGMSGFLWLEKIVDEYRHMLDPHDAGLEF